MPKRPAGDYEVGKGRPPTHTQFKKGQSGNPSGRPKGAVSLKTDLEAELGREVTVNENGQSQTLTMQRLLVKTTLNRAVKGDRHAAALVVDLIARAFGLTGEAEETEAPLPAEDQAVLDAFEAQLASKYARRAQDDGNGG